ncbi:sensor histidine kinase [Actinomadura craniellae]|uniref:histidine kinase n=1 Tax=Actinomadura craniellae TaxID=2231787 RepID=A0A365HBN3_9ACTN|nr:histidine kinase [Actinomadura craniellae]RAY16449.1 sensor histidine kinase [Actinomadura craniellae]
MRWGRGAAWWPRRRSRVLDISLALTAALLDGTLLWFVVRDFYIPSWVSAAASVLIGLILVARRRYPVAVATLSIAGGFVAGGFLSYFIALYSMGAYCATRRLVTGLAVAAYVAFIIQPGPGMGEGGPFWGRLILGVAIIVPPVLLGLYMGTRKQLVASLQERAARLERERNLLAEQARIEERTRIAREMHDVVANRVSVMVVHAGALRAVAARDPAKAAETAAVIGDMGRQALDELRQVIGVLRLGDAAELPDTPGLTDIRGLVDQSAAAGLPVTLRIEGLDHRPPPPTVAQTLYRVVQEALTNVHKHAGNVDTGVTIELREAVDVEVRNGPPEAGPDHELPSGGNGLLGLRERVVALGGTFEAGPCDRGGFAVRARIPLPAVAT